MSKQKIRMGMVGGGQGAFIGAVHRMAARLDNEIELVCGAFSSNAERAKASGAELGLPEERSYVSWKTMLEREAKLPEEQRMQFLSIVTPNNLHFEPAKLALELGFAVLSDKPLCLNVHEAEELRDLAKQQGLLFGVTYTYSGYPMVKQARQLVAEGKLGAIRKVVVEYPQGWLYQNIEQQEQKQATWRTDPAKAGLGGALGDIGTHAAHLAEYISGQKIVKVLADLGKVVSGRKLDDDATVLLRFENKARGVLIASQVSAGEENALKIRVYGSEAGLSWHQMEPNSLLLHHPEQPMKTYRTGTPAVSNAAAANTRVPAGHPEGYLEAFANIYRNFALALRAQQEGKKPDELMDYPTVTDGLRGMKFVEKAVESDGHGQVWVDL